MRRLGGLKDARVLVGFTQVERQNINEHLAAFPLQNEINMPDGFFSGPPLTAEVAAYKNFLGIFIEKKKQSRAQLREQTA
jgi:negative regulator of genetic competence, sporulation and motility